MILPVVSMVYECMILWKTNVNFNMSPIQSVRIFFSLKRRWLQFLQIFNKNSNIYISTQAQVNATENSSYCQICISNGQNN